MMLLGPDKKKMVSIIVGSAKPDYVHKSGPSEGKYVLPEKEDEGEDSGKMAAAEAAMSALEKKDARGFAMAVQDLVDMCLAEPMPKDEEEEMED